MNRLDYYFRQQVTEAELDAGFGYAEDADRDMVVDRGLVGIISGLAVVEQGAPNLTVECALGIAYTPQGERCEVPSAQDINCAADFNAVSTTVAGVGNEKWLSIFIMSDRALSDARTDGNDVTVYFERAETFEFKVVQGTEAGAGLATRPALDANGKLLCDVLIVFGTTSIINSMISTTRREDAIVVAGTPRALRRGLQSDANSDLLSYYNAHINASADKHAATDITYAGGGTWADGTTNPATSVELQLDKVVTDLSAVVSNTSGAKRVGSNFSAPATPAWAAGGYTLASGTVQSHLSSLLSYANANAAAISPKKMIGFFEKSFGFTITAGVTSATHALGHSSWEVSLGSLNVGDTFMLFSSVGISAGATNKHCGVRWCKGEAGAAVSLVNTVGQNYNGFYPAGSGFGNNVVVFAGGVVAAAGTFLAKLSVCSLDGATSFDFLPSGVYAVAFR